MSYSGDCQELIYFGLPRLREGDLANKNKAKGKSDEYGFWRMVRDVLIASMNKGQLPGAALALVILSLIWEMPSADVGKLVFILIADLENGRLVGWGVAIVCLVAWSFHARHQRRLITGEMRRISNERNALQSQSIPGKVKSSEGR
jgi:hypothetical protein